MINQAIDNKSDAVVEQIYTGCLSQAAYFLESNGEAAVIDPLRDPQPYLDRAERNGSKIKWIFETHFHADFVSGHLELQRLTGATIVYGPSAKPNFTAHIARDGEAFAIGDITLKLLHTPGHTLESSCYLLLFADGQAKGVFTGDTLFLGDVGRPDLAVRSDISKEDLAGLLYDSLHKQILPLADSVIIYPGHGAGSACGKHLSKETQDTLGHQKQVNYALRAQSKSDFVREVLAGMSPPPAYFPENARMNREGYAPVSEAMHAGLQALSPEAFEAAANQTGAVVLDTRSAESFANGFIPRSINIGLDGQFASWVGALIGDLKQPILLVTEPGRENEAVTRLTRIGYDHPIGYLQGGLSAWHGKGRELDTLAGVVADRLEATLKQKPEIQIIDVRTPQEFDLEHIAGALNIPLDNLNQRMGELSHSGHYLLHCAGGYRSMIAASILKARGFADILNLVGGINALKQTDFANLFVGNPA
jgi:hydroxyacylglutathione hydrolase